MKTVYILEEYAHYEDTDFIAGWLEKPTIEQLAGQLELTCNNVSENQLQELYENGDCSVRRGSTLYFHEVDFIDNRKGCKCD